MAIAIIYGLSVLPSWLETHIEIPTNSNLEDYALQAKVEWKSKFIC
ncbi:hypothetical protein [Chakrabartyella piscis]|nr:hypothetical protein [Chakrabartyella piscis]